MFGSNGRKKLYINFLRISRRILCLPPESAILISKVRGRIIRRLTCDGVNTVLDNVGHKYGLVK
jgi:hypothetical protein